MMLQPARIRDVVLSWRDTLLREACLERDGSSCAA
jgi:hypothetical protein